MTSKGSSTTVLDNSNPPTNVLIKRHNPAKKKKPKKHVHWTEETVDNEHLGKKSSKICCVYRRPLQFGESDSSPTDSSDYYSEEDDDESQQGHQHSKGCDHNHNESEVKTPHHQHHQHSKN